MMLSPLSRESGVEFACGAYLLALGIGLLIPRTGVGLYSMLHSSGYAWLWSTAITTTALGLMLVSFFRVPRVRLYFVAAALACWTALAFRFVEASLWGAVLQSVVAVLLLNGCLFRLLWYLRGSRP